MRSQVTYLDPVPNCVLAKCKVQIYKMQIYKVQSAKCKVPENRTGTLRIGVLKLSERKICISKIFILHLFIFLLFFTLLSCGYTLNGGGELPGKPKNISVLLFKNRSSHTGAETALANALIAELMCSSRVGITDDPDNADAVIQGEITSISFGTLSRTSYDSVYERAVTVTVDLNMKSRSGEVHFSSHFSERDTYSVSKDNETDESAKREVIEKLFYRLSQRIVAQMTDNF